LRWLTSVPFWQMAEIEINAVYPFGSPGRQIYNCSTVAEFLQDALCRTDRIIPHKQP
jgi:hypothetical protein